MAMPDKNMLRGGTAFNLFDDSVRKTAAHVENPEQMPGRIRVEDAASPEIGLGNRRMLEFDGYAVVENVRAVPFAIGFQHDLSLGFGEL